MRYFITIEGTEDKAGELFIADLIGKIVLRKSVMLTPGLSSFNINTDAFSGGLYFISLRTESKIISRKLVKK